MNLYRNELLEISKKYMELINIAYRKFKRRLYKLTYGTHNIIVHALDDRIEF